MWQNRCMLNITLANLWKYFKLESESSPVATCNICNTTISRGGKRRAAFNNTNLIRHIKKQTLKEHSAFTQATPAKAPKQQTVADTLKRKYPRDSDIPKNITEKVIEFIVLDNQLISMVKGQGCLYHLEFWNPRYALPSQHYITLLRVTFVGLIQKSK